MTKFHASQFTATEWSTAEEKAKWANHYVRFVTGGFKATVFTKAFYRRLSGCFGHIAHYNQAGFYETWFTTTRTKAQFLINAARWPCHGSPAFTYSDVERVLQTWVTESGLIEKLVAEHKSEVEQRERAELARLQAKYETATEGA